MEGAYGTPSISFGGVAGDGTGETIAILDPGDDTGMVNSTASNFSTSDLAIFDSYYGLSNPTFTKMGFTDTSTPALTTTLPASNGTNGNDIEISIDVEWAHVMAPKANILLVEGNPNFSDIYSGVYAVNAAASSMHIVVLSMSFGGAESQLGSTSEEQAYDAYYFDTPGIVYCASTGDSGAYAPGTTTITPNFPASSSNVLAVGGTTLSVSANNYSSESTWGNGTSSGSSGGGGGGFSLYEPQPTYQVGKVNGLSTTARTIPDIAMDANPASGVAIYDSVDYGVGTGWSALWGGTSLASPLMAGLVAIADQGRGIYGLSLLNSSGDSGQSASNPNGNSASLDIHNLLYGFGNSASDFHDITSGSSIGPSNYGPTTGYDLSTGLGSALATKLDEDLVANTDATESWLTGAATYNTTTHSMFVTGAAKIGADPGSAEPIVQASTSSDVVTLDPSSGTDIHIQGISLTGGASAVVTSLGVSRTVSNYHLLVVGVTGATTAPLFTIDSISTLDMTDNDMAILYGSGTSPLTTVNADISEAYDNKLWDKPGLTSSIAKTMPSVTALGFGEASTLGFSTFDGLTLGGNAVVVKYTLVGDANLDGTVNLADYNKMLSNFNATSGATWTGGSFDYSGSVGLADYNDVIHNFNQTLANVLT